jgi:tetratricopeptide (TPR) repeat protein
MSNVLQTGLTVVSIALFLIVTLSEQGWGSDTDTLYLDLKGTFDIGMFGVGLDIAVTPDGKIFISDPVRSCLWNLQEDSGTFVRVNLKGVRKDYHLNPVAIAADQNMRLWIANPDLHQILVCQTNGKITAIFDRKTMPIDWPVSLSRLPDGRIAAWDSEQKALLIFSMAENKVLVRSLKGALRDDAVECLAENSGAVVCIDSERRTLIKIKSEKVAARKSLPEKSGKDYVRLSHLEIGPGGYVFVTDSAGRRLMYFSSDLEIVGCFLLYEHLFRTPSSFAFQGSNLWLIDEGRKELMHFVVRSASSGLDHALLGEEYLALGYFAPAMKAFITAKKLGKSGPDIELALGKAFYGLKQYTKALSAFSRAEKGGDPAGFFWIGNALFRLGRYTAAENSYKSSLAKQKSNSLVRFNLGQTYLALNRFRDAEAAFSQILTTEPSFLQATMGLGKAYIGQKRYLKAGEIFRKLTLVEPLAREARYYLGISYLGLGEYETAIPLLECAASQGPYFKDAFRALARACKSMGNPKAAGRYARKADAIKNDQLFKAYLLEDQLL